MSHYNYRTIDGSEEKISKVLNALDLKVIDKKFTVAKAIRLKKRYYSPLCRANDGKIVFLKARLQNTLEVLATLKKEIFFHKKVGPVISSTKPRFFIPPLLGSGGSGDFIWMVRECLEGEFAGSMGVDLGMKKEMLNRINPRELALKILSLQKISSRLLKIIKLRRHGFHWFDVDYNYYRRTLSLNGLIPNELSQIAEIYKKNKSLFNKYARVVSHGDLYPNNILLLKNGRVTLIDWELANINNPAFDPAFIWMLSFRNKAWQKTFLNTVLQNIKNRAIFQKLFRLSVLSLSLRFLRVSETSINVSAKVSKILKEEGFGQKDIKAMPSMAKEAKKYHLNVLDTAIKHPSSLFD